MLFIITEHIAVGCFFLDGTDRSCLEGLSFSEQDLRVGMCLALILSRKIQVDIRLLVSLEAEEGLERDIESVLDERLSAYRAVLVRHVITGTVLIFLRDLRVKIHIVAFWAAVVRRQRIDLGDPAEGCCQRGAHGSTGAYQETVLHAVLHEALRNDVHDGVAVADDRVQFLVETGLYDIRQVISVHGSCRIIAGSLQLLIRVLNDRRALVRTDRSDALTHVRDPVRHIDHDFSGLFLP